MFASSAEHAVSSDAGQGNDINKSLSLGQDS